jgi:soluble lytic murein transglycosylase
MATRSRGGTRIFCGGESTALRRVIRSVLAGLLLACSIVIAARAELGDSDRNLYRLAYQAGNAGKWDDAWSLARRANDPFPQKLLRWIELTRGGPNARFEDIRDFLVANPDWPGQILLRQRAEEVLPQGDAVAAAWFQLYPPVTPSGKIREAELAIGAGHEAEGTARLRAIWISTDFSAVDEKSFLERYRGYLRPEDHARRIDRLIWDSRYTEARQMLPRVSLEQRALGDARIALATVAPNAEHLLHLVPASLQRNPGLLYERLRWRRRREHYDDAIDVLDHPPADLVRPLAWAGERQSLARIALSEGNISVAYRLAARHGLSEGPAFADLEFFAGWVALRFLREPGTGYDHFVTLYDRSKTAASKARGAYWAARAAAAMHLGAYASGWDAKAAEYRTTYYGQLAATAVGQTGITVTAEPEPSEHDIAEFEAHELVRAARDLVAIGDDEDVGSFLARLTDSLTAPTDFVQVVRLALAVDRPDMELRAAQRAASAGIALFAESYPLVPLPPGGATEAALVLAVTRQESAFDVGAVSSAGARGMMQLMPATAKRVAKILDMPYSEDLLTRDRVYNLKLGRSYLDEMLTEFDGSYVLTVAAYNAGPARVHQWLDELGDPRSPGTDVVDWIESVPISETRNYMQRVLENLQIYRLRLGDNDRAFKLASDLKR